MYPRIVLLNKKLTAAITSLLNPKPEIALCVSIYLPQVSPRRNNASLDTFAARRFCLARACTAIPFHTFPSN